MDRWIYMNGEFVRAEEALVSVYDRGFLFGDGVFEGIRAYEGNVFMLKEHIDRLFESAKAILLDIPYSYQEVEQAVIQTLIKNKQKTAYIRIVVSRGVGEGYNLDPFLCPAPQFIVITEPFEAFPAASYDQGIDIITVATRRNRADVLSPQVKSLNYLNNILVKSEARLAGVKEGLMLNTEGYVVEGTTNNIFILKNGKLLTPPSYTGILEGITRSVVMKLAQQMNIQVEEKPITRHDVYTASEVLLTGTATEIMAVVKVDGRTIADGLPGEVTKRLTTQFRDYRFREGVKYSIS